MIIIMHLYTENRMANRFLESVGEVDVVSDSENIKKLLKIPFAGNQSTISMMVHRVGRTLLIDDFDLSSLALQEHEFQWSWLRKLIYEVLVLSKSQLEVPSKIESSRVQTMRMFEQFLRHSLSLAPKPDPTQSTHECENDFLHLVEVMCDHQEQKAREPYAPGSRVSSSSLDLIPASSIEEVSESRKRTGSILTTSPAVEANLDLSLDFFERQLDRIDDIYSVGKKERQFFEEEGGKTEQEQFVLGGEDKLLSSTQPNRNLFWKFEDIKMLLGSDMPIFGDQSHPAVSLRLHDMTEPINVLTGLDYWLDNLMCSVPEVIMCYHLDGIVQKYESIKTEDIPNMSSSSFSPFVVRNIAQNILTFLKSKATKSGHTYWLFKGKNDDVVKLYDLTSLYLDHNVSPPSTTSRKSSPSSRSEERRNDSTSQPEGTTDSDNPYLIPVAMLLYRVAKNVKESSIGSSSSPQRERTVYKLLENCIRLLGLCTSKNHSMVVQVSISARYLMAQLLCPDLEESVKRSSSSASSLEDQDFFYQDDEEIEKTEVDDSLPNSTNANDKYISALNVKTLCEFPMKEGETSFLRTCHPSAKQSECLIETSDPREKLMRCSQYLLDGIDLLSNIKTEKRLSPRKQAGQKMKEEEVMREAKSFEPIPMKFKSDVQTDIEKKVSSSQVMAVDDELESKEEEKNNDWYNLQMKLFTTKLCQVLYSLTDLYLEGKQYFNSLSLIQAAFSFLEMASSFGNSSLDSIELSLLVSLAADMNILNNSWSSCKPDPMGNDKELESLLDRINDILVRTSIDLSGKYSDIYTKIYSNSECSREEILCESIKLYEQSLNCLKSFRAKNEQKDFIELKIMELTKKYGNACNELGCLYMNEATKIYSEAMVVDKSLFATLESVTKKSLSCFVKGVTSFDSINDPVNSCFLYSNLGKLMRICAHVFAPVNESSKERSSEFNMKENHLYSKSVHYYSMALSKLDSTSPSILTELKGTIIWDLSTTLYTWGCLMQDFPPLNIKAYESIEKQIQDCMVRSLELVNKFLAEKSTQSSSSQDDPRLVLFKFRAGNILAKLASLFHHSFRNMSESEPKRKQVFITSDDYYQQCSDIFMQLPSPSVSKEFLESCLERIALHEHNLSNLNGITSKMKAVNNLFLIFRSISTFLRNILVQDANELLFEKEEQIDVQSIQKLVYLLIQRFEVNVEEILKLVSGKSMKKSSNQKKEKEKWENIKKKLQDFGLLKASELKKVVEENNEEGRKNWLKSTIESFCNLCDMTN